MSPNARDEIAEKIYAVLRPRLRFLGDGQPIPPDENLGKLGLDSMGAIDLLLDLEQTLGIKIPDALLTAETFETASSLERTVRSLVKD